MTQTTKQQDAPTDAELVRKHLGRVTPNLMRDALTLVGAARYAPAQDAEQTRDAERYRWLRDKSEPRICAFYLSVGMAFHGVRFKPETVDEAIDAARAGKGE